MNEIGQDFFLGLAGVSATLLGTFIVGVFFYIDSDMHRRLTSSVAADMYLRSGMRWVFAAYAVPLIVPLVLVALEPLWGAVTFILLAGILAAMTIDTARRVLAEGGAGTSRTLIVNEWVTSVAVLAAVILPWAVGGWIPEPVDFVPSLLLILASGFTSTAALVMAEFDSTMGM